MGGCMDELLYQVQLAWVYFVSVLQLLTLAHVPLSYKEKTSFCAYYMPHTVPTHYPCQCHCCASVVDVVHTPKKKFRQTLRCSSKLASECIWAHYSGPYCPQSPSGQKVIKLIKMLLWTRNIQLFWVPTWIILGIFLFKIRQTG